MSLGELKNKDEYKFVEFPDYVDRLDDIMPNRTGVSCMVPIREDVWWIIEVSRRRGLYRGKTYIGLALPYEFTPGLSSFISMELWDNYGRIYLVGGFIKVDREVLDTDVFDVEGNPFLAEEYRYQNEDFSDAMMAALESRESGSSLSYNFSPPYNHIPLIFEAISKMNVGLFGSNTNLIFKSGLYVRVYGKSYHKANKTDYTFDNTVLDNRYRTIYRYAHSVLRMNSSFNGELIIDDESTTEPDHYDDENYKIKISVLPHEFDLEIVDELFVFVRLEMNWIGSRSDDKYLSDGFNKIVVVRNFGATIDDERNVVLNGTQLFQKSQELAEEYGLKKDGKNAYSDRYSISSSSTISVIGVYAYYSVKDKFRCGPVEIDDIVKSTISFEKW